MEQKFLEDLKLTLEIEDREVTMSDHFKDYDEWDSLARLSLIVMLDDKYGIQIEDDEFNNLKTVGDIFHKIQ